MPEYASFTTGEPSWVELGTSDVPGAIDFYAAVLGWTFQDMGPESGHYRLIRAGDRVVGGAGAPITEGAPAAWSVYFNAPDLGVAHERALAAGAQTIIEPTQIGPAGSLAFLEDNRGARFGLWMAGERKGFDAWGETGTTAWFELHTPAMGASADHYAAVTGLTPNVMADDDHFRYTQLAGAAGGVDAKFGILERSELATAQWLTYFLVDSTDAAVDVARARGASIHVEPVDSPFGRMSTLGDPSGALFSLIQRTES